MITGADAEDAAIVDLDRVRAIVSALGEARFLQYRGLLQTRLTDLGALLNAGSPAVVQAQALAHQCHGSASAMGLSQLARALGEIEDLLRRGKVDLRALAAHDLADLQAVAWRVIAEQVPALATS
jgi:hypothetical protein